MPAYHHQQKSWCIWTAMNMSYETWYKWSFLG